MASSSGRVGATEGSSPGRPRPPDPCLDCLHDLLSAAKRLRGCEALPNDLAHQVSTQCREVHRVLEKADGRSLRLLDVLCSRHSGDINDKLNAHLLTLCFKHLEVRKKKIRTGCMLCIQLTLAPGLSFVSEVRRPVPGGGRLQAMAPGGLLGRVLGRPAPQAPHLQLHRQRASFVETPKRLPPRRLQAALSALP